MSDIKMHDLRPAKKAGKEAPHSFGDGGVHVHVRGAQVTKLGLQNAQTGAEHEIRGKVKIIAARVPEDGEDENAHHVEMHVTHMGVSEPDEPSLRDQIENAAEKDPAPKKKAK